MSFPARTWTDSTSTTCSIPSPSPPTGAARGSYHLPTASLSWTSAPAAVSQAVAEALGLDNVTVVNARAESLPAVYDFVVSRAVTSLDNFYPWVRDRFRYSIFYLKGGDINAEIAQLMGRNRLKKGSVHTWRVDNWLPLEYFQEKFVIQIEKDYLCSPIVE